MIRILSALLAACCALCLGLGCAESTSPSSGDGAGVDPRDRPLSMAIIHFGPVDFDDPQQLAELARADVLILSAEHFWKRTADPQAVAKLKAFNPQLKVLGYVNVKHVRTDWAAPEMPPEWRAYYPYDLYDATLGYWSWTTEGDTLLDFPSCVVINITNPACRRAMLDNYASHHRNSNNKLDGVYWDYFSPTLWIHPDVQVDMHGEPDLDGDGISHFEDADELAAWQAAQVDLVQGLRWRLGQDFIQVFNGTRAALDSSFAALGDGMFYELFPTLPFHGGPQMELALDPAQYNNLFAARNWPRRRNGGPWLILSHRNEIAFLDDQNQLYRMKFAEFNRVVALLTGCTAVYHREEQYLASWPEVELDLGNPLGGVTREDRVLTREFERGRVTLTFTNGEWPLPFDFEIVQDRQVVQALHFPAHVP